MGLFTIARDYGSLVIGAYNDVGNTSNRSATSLNSDNQAFVIGNGTGNDSRSNALVIDFFGNIETEGAVFARTYYVITDNGFTQLSSIENPFTGEEADEFEAVTGQTGFTLSRNPKLNTKAKMFVNGSLISLKAFTVKGLTVTYFPENNKNYVLAEGDLIQIFYFY
jgi:hypothetical protein